MEINALVKKIIYRKEDSFWSILECRSAKGDIKIVGITTAKEGQVITARGDWAKDQKGNKQFKATKISLDIPNDKEGMERYLSCGAIPGIGPSLAEKIVNKFGSETFSIIDVSPNKLLSIDGVSQKLLNRITEAWKANKSLELISDFLTTHKLPLYLANQIQSEFGSTGLVLLQKNPYELTTAIKGFGFKSADKIALSLGLEMDSVHRVRSAVLYELDRAVSNGSCGIKMEVLVSALVESLTVKEASVHEAVKILLGEEKPLIIFEDMIVWSKDLYDAEENIADLLLSKIKNTKPLLPPDKIEALISERLEELGFELAEEQKEAIRYGLTKGVMIITGGPGVGKTFTTDSVLWALKKLDKEIVLTAPTGKAAQRATEATGIPAETMHRLMGVGEEDDSEPQTISADVVTADEVSMADVPIVNHLCNAVSLHTRIILVGDFDQLLSVGAGNVLKDMINSGVIPVIRLTKVYRQAEGSLIIKNAHNINKGLSLVNGRTADDDFWILSEANKRNLKAAFDVNEDTFAQEVAQMICHYVSKQIPQKRGIDPSDIWVLSPTNKGPCGVDALNQLLQETLNPHPVDSLMTGSTRFGVDDRVMQVKNNYDLDIFNGDTGRVKYVNRDDGVLEIKFEGRDELVCIPFEELNNLRLGYAMTIHRSQGSQARAVVIPLLMQHYTLLQRNIVYTGITRAKDLAVLIGQGDAIRLSVNRIENTQRVTRLEQLLIDGM